MQAMYAKLVSGIMFKNHSIIMNDGKTILSHLFCYDSNRYMIPKAIDTCRVFKHCMFVPIKCMCMSDSLFHSYVLQ